ncbi:MAG: T9SS type A sorting domain-containing protein [Ignavibacteria bacterium]|nr:T9SS type A sorting domain-containing protein [Ignavibacteria bacterium]
MLKFILNLNLLIILLSGLSFAQVNWVRQNSPVTSALFNCVFTDSLNGWAAGEEGVIIHTSDGGTNWIIQSNPVNYYINDIFFINKNTGWCVSNEFLLNGTTLIKTTNGGNNWVAESFPDSTVFFRTIYFLDSLNGYLAGFFGKIYKTTDGGDNWFPTVTDTSNFSQYPINKIEFLNAQTGFACGGIIDIAGVIWSTFDSGLTWTARDYAAEPFYDMLLTNEDRLFAVGGDFEYGTQFILSTNSGVNWNYTSLAYFGQGQSIDFRTKSEIWMPLGFSGAWAFSNDTGYTWSTFPATDNASLNSITFADSLHGWAVGNFGVILKYVHNLVSVTPDENSIANEFYLSQNFPNPFNPSTVIKFSIPKSGKAELKVFDSRGSEVRELLNEYLSAGSYEYTFDAVSLPSGVYFYTLITPEFNATKKMILIR